MTDQNASPHVCSHRHSFSLDNIFRSLIQPPKKIVGPYIAEGDTVIDLGCGPGFFTLPMAELAGNAGHVIAVDLQSEMLAKIRKKLDGSPLKNRITLHRCRADSLNLDESVRADFVLAYYMIHETPDQPAFFKAIKKILKPGGKVLVVEPPFHVNKKAFSKSMEYAEKSGFTVLETPRRKGGLAMLLSVKPEPTLFA